MNQSNVDLPWAGRRRRARLLLFALIGVPPSLMEGKRRFIRLRHLPEKICPDFVPSSCNTQSISAKKRLPQASIYLAICSCLMNHRLPKVSGWHCCPASVRPFGRRRPASKLSLLSGFARDLRERRRVDQARALLAGDTRLVPIAPMGCRPSPVPRSLPPKNGFVNE